MNRELADYAARERSSASARTTLGGFFLLVASALLFVSTQSVWAIAGGTCGVLMAVLLWASTVGRLNSLTVRLTCALRHAEERADEAASRVDPWEMQRALMEASDQRIAANPVLHNGSLLYAALIMEEAGELFGHVGNTLAAMGGGAGADLLSEIFADRASSCHRGSLLARQVIAQITVNHPLSSRHAAALFDDTTDIAVVNCGFALSAGFPAAAGYAEVGDSNLSKANPKTGKIDKDASGKWIKGPNYREPDLATLLALRPRHGRADKHASGHFPPDQPPKAFIGAPAEEVRRHVESLGG